MPRLSRFEVLPVLGLVTVVTVPAAHAQHADEIYAERTIALAIDARCDLFSDGQRAALDAARLQARGALLRSGVEPVRLLEFGEAVEDDVADQACDDEQTLAMQAIVNSAYEAYLRIPEMSFPGDAFDWEANRLNYAAKADWVVRQDAGEVQAGLTSIEAQVKFTVSTPDPGQYSGAVLVLRDPQREPELYDPTVGGLFDAPDEAPWARWTPPDRARQLFWASERVTGDAAVLISGSPGAQVYRFPDAAARAISALDPRESVRVDYLNQQGQPVMSKYFEVGDFGAAVAFLQAIFNTETDT